MHTANEDLQVRIMMLLADNTIDHSMNQGGNVILPKPLPNSSGEMLYLPVYAIDEELGKMAILPFRDKPNVCGEIGDIPQLQKNALTVRCTEKE